MQSNSTLNIICQLNFSVKHTIYRAQISYHYMMVVPTPKGARTIWTARIWWMYEDDAREADTKPQPYRSEAFAYLALGPIESQRAMLQDFAVARSVDMLTIMNQRLHLLITHRRQRRINPRYGNIDRTWQSRVLRMIIRHRKERGDVIFHKKKRKVPKQSPQ